MTKPETKLVLVEAVSQHRIRYVIEVPAGKEEWALDTVVCNDAKEFGQRHLDEVIVSHRIVEQKDLLALAKEDNEYITQELMEKSITLLEDVDYLKD